MSDHSVTLNLPGAIFAPLRQIAKVKAQSVEQVVIDQLRSVIEVQLPTLPPDEEAELAAFKFLSDDTLRSIAREQMAAPLQVQMQNLMDRNSAGTITPEEYQ
ncbi:MAG: hypothetical protein H7X77_03805, partial [Anaerolineae bacterium]|nr:hypothetical protein [Anaerolineae bacterium]